MHNNLKIQTQRLVFKILLLKKLQLHSPEVHNFDFFSSNSCEYYFYKYELNVRIEVKDTTFVYFFFILVCIYSNFVYNMKLTIRVRAVFGSHVSAWDSP